jgi:hypothetical protein
LNLGTVLLLFASLLSPGADAKGGAHLLAGADAFRNERYGEALVEFRVAQRLGSIEAGPYAAAALLKLGRVEEAVEAFRGTPGDGDALLDYYHAVACYEGRLYLCADRLLAAVGARSGPRIADQAARMRALIAAELAGEPPRTSIDWYLARCAERRDGGRPALAQAFCHEAVGLAERRADRYRFAEASTALATLSPPGTVGSSR